MKNTMQHIGERGGGRPEIAMGGAPNIESVKKAIHWAKEELIKHHD
jgi:alanyl-tRNA synthetase